MRRPTPAHVVERIVHLRRHRLTGAHIAAATGVSAATADRVLKRAGLSRIRDLEPEEPARRYEHDNPGDMIHLDIKRLGRFRTPGHRVTGTRAGRRQGSGWECARVCVDDASRVACGGLFPNERQESAVECLATSADCYKRLGVTVRRVMTDNGPCYTSKAFAAACRRFGVRHVRTKPYTPRTNGGAELHPNGHEGVGLRPDLPDLGRARRRPPGMDPHVQLAQATLRHRFEAAHQPHPNGQRQPVASPHLCSEPLPAWHATSQHAKMPLALAEQMLAAFFSASGDLLGLGVSSRLCCAPNDLLVQRGPKTSHDVDRALTGHP